MKNQKHVSSLAIAAPRPTRAAAVLIAVTLSVPVFVMLTLIEWLLQ